MLIAALALVVGSIDLVHQWERGAGLLMMPLCVLAPEVGAMGYAETTMWHHATVQRQKQLAQILLGR